MQNKIVQITKITPEESKAIEEMMKYLILSICQFFKINR